MRCTLSAAVFTFAGLVLASSSPAQTIGVGGRFSMVRGDVQAETSAERFIGGQLRLGLTRRTSVELSLDRRTETNDAETERTRDYPLQASLLLFPIRSTISPYLLGGAGWYSQRLDRLDGEEVIETVSARRFGYHAGFGGELRLGRRAGLHADYRYTFLRFGSDDEAADADHAGSQGAQEGKSLLPSRFLPSYEGSMWTAGLTIYF